MCLYSSRFIGLPDPRFAGMSPKPQYAPDRNFATVHVKLELDVDFQKKIISGICSTTLKSLNGKNILNFDAKNFKITSVKAGGKPVKYRYDSSKIEIDTGKIESGKEIQVVIEYKLVAPKLGIYFVEPDKFYPKNPVQAWSHSQTDDARYWWPSQDMPNEKATTETIITVPAGFVAISNGKLVKALEDKKKKTKTYHWRMSKPHSTYLLNFVIGSFSEIKDKWKDIPVLYYCEKGREEEIKRAFGKTPQMIDLFSKMIGVGYPYEKYAQIAVADFIFGGMEHTTSTTQTDSVLHDERAHEEAKYHSDGLCAHELAHQWFGDLITCKDWSHSWLNESFATYFDALFAEHDKGEDEFAYEMYQNAQEYFSEDRDKYRRAIVTNLFRRSEDMFDRHLYQKGAYVLHMLRAMLGDRLWWAAINNYVKKNQNSEVETLDLIASIEESTGLNMKKFFDQWVFNPGHPEYKVLYFYDGKKKEANVRIIQTQPADTQLFSVRMKIEFTTPSGIKSFEETVEQKEQLFTYKIDNEPTMVRIDPDYTILKKMEQVKSKSLWLNQLRLDSNVVGRIAAAAEISKNGTQKDAKILGDAMLNEKFWGVQAEIATLLGQMRNQTALDYLVKGLSLKHPLARRAAVAALGEFKDPRVIKEIKHLLDDKNSYLVPAEVCRTLGKTRDISVEPILKTMTARDSWIDAIRAGAVDGFAHLHGTDSIEILKEYAQRGNAHRTRMFAIKNLGTLGKGRKDVIDFLINLTEDRFALVQIAAVKALGELGDERAIPVLEDLTKGDRFDRLKRAAEDSIKQIYTWLDTDIESYRVTEEVRRKMEEKQKEADIMKRSLEK